MLLSNHYMSVSNRDSKWICLGPHSESKWTNYLGQKLNKFSRAEPLRQCHFIHIIVPRRESLMTMELHDLGCSSWISHTVWRSGLVLGGWRWWKAVRNHGDSVLWVVNGVFTVVWGSLWIQIAPPKAEMGERSSSCPPQPHHQGLTVESNLRIHSATKQVFAWPKNMKPVPGGSGKAPLCVLSLSDGQTTQQNPQQFHGIRE